MNSSRPNPEYNFVLFIARYIKKFFNHHFKKDKDEKIFKN